MAKLGFIGNLTFYSVSSKGLLGSEVTLPMNNLKGAAIE
jgi:hypothetical protein